MPGHPPPRKRKANLANALASHTQRKAEKAHQVKVEEAEKRKKQSLSGGAGQHKKRKVEGGSREAIQRLLEEGQDQPESSKASTSTASSSRSTHWPFHPLDTILLIGEGDFSFTLSLVTSSTTTGTPPHSPHRIVATSFEPSLSHLTRKYPHTAPANISRLESLGVTIRVNIDAAAPLRDPVLRKWCDPKGETKGFTKVWWGFPHAGGGEKDEGRNVAKNQLMLCRGFVGLRGVMRAGGRRPGYARKGTKGKGGKGGKGAQPTEEEEDDAEDEEDYPEITDDDDEDEEANDGPPKERVSSYPPHPLPPPHLPSSLLITLRPVKPYTLWRLPHLGSSKLSSLYPLVLHNAPPLPKGAPRNPTVVEIEDAERRKGGGGCWEVWTSRSFRPEEWKGYRHVTTSGGREGREMGGRGSGLLDGGDGDDEAQGEGKGKSVECRTWEFGLSGTPQ